MEKFDLEYSTNIILGSKSFSKDINVILSFSQFFSYVWDLFILIKCFKVVIAEYHDNELEENQQKFVPVIETYISKIEDTGQTDTSASEDSDTLNSTFQWCLSKVTLHIESSIKKARPTEPDFHYDISKFLTKAQVIHQIIPRNVLLSFKSIVKLCIRDFFISFDGFDTKFEKFRSNSSYYPDEIKEFRADIEKSFLEGFLLRINEIKGNPNQNTLYGKISVCVTVPKDRFFEIKYDQRDSYRYINRFHEIKWTGIELAIMLRKRLELLYQYQSPKFTNSGEKVSAIDRMADTVEETIGSLPKETSIRIDGRLFSKDTFINVLRHSFWRPREVIIYYSKLIAVLNDFEKRAIDPDNFTISKIVSETTFDIINEEFISEFKNYCQNIEQVLYCFKESNQINELDEIQQRISEVDFFFVHESEPVKDFTRKIEFLYDIGLLGFEIEKSTQDRFKLLIKDIFCFNVSSRTFDSIKQLDFEECKFIIHPIFCEFLNLNTSSQDRLVLDMDWNYLRSQDIYVRP